MSVLSNFLKKTAPIVAAVAPGTPIGTVAQVKTIQDAQAQQRFLRNTQIEAYEQQKRNNTMALDPSQMIGQRSSVISATQPQLGFFDRLSNLGSQVGNTLLTGLESAVPSVINRAIFGRGTTTTATQGPAVTTTTNVGAQESQGSGTIDAFSGLTSFAPAISAAGRFIKSPGGSLATGTGAGLLSGLFGSEAPKMRITRKMKSQYRSVLNLAGGDYALAANMIGVSQDMFIMVLLKRFRNDGPVVTKAALRKTKTTVRRLKSMCDMYDSLRPTAARRRAPMKRASSTTLIKN